MDINWDNVCKRVRILRREHLNNISQTEFGNRLGVSRSVINNIERNALAQPEHKKSLFQLICHEFHVSEDWLLYGKGDVFTTQEQFDLNEFVKMHNGTDYEVNIMKAYFEIDYNTRHALVDHFKAYLAGEHEL